MNVIKTKGIITRQTNYRDYDRIFTLITNDYGKIDAVGRMARRIKSPLSSTCQLLYYCDFVLSDKKNNGIYQIDSAEIIESFHTLPLDLEKASYAFYFAELASHLTEEMIADTNILRLLLNTLHTLAYKDVSAQWLRVVFELRVMAYSGFAPVINACINCDGTDNLLYFDPVMGGLVCNNCTSSATRLIPISQNAIDLMNVILTSKLSELINMTADKMAIKEITEIMERYIKIHTEHEFKTLQMLKTLI